MTRVSSKQFAFIQTVPSEEAIMEESSLLGVDLGHVLIREVDVADGVRENVCFLVSSTSFS